MISLLLEKRRKQAQKTVLGIEYDRSSLAAVKLNKSPEGYSLVSCDSDVFPEEAYFEGELTSDYIGTAVSNIIADNKIGRFLKLGFTCYNDIDVTKDEIVCDKKALEVIEKESVFAYLTEHFFKKKYPENYTQIAYDYYDNIEEKGAITVYHVSDRDKIQQFHNISRKTKKALAVCTLDKLAITSFVEELFLTELAKNPGDSVFLGLYSDKLSIYSFSKDGELRNYESIKIFDPNMADANYVDEVIQLLLRFMDFMSLDFTGDDFDDFGIQENIVYIYGLKQNFENIFESITELSQKNCQKLDPFVNISHDNYNYDIDQPYRYVLPVAIAMKEAL
ncbi:type IV pili [Candidatus Francisella endociliophora]|uniref:Type IV pili n=1 Tax=Candidatus Francisella endociliophora TaxID=653937 RepID=A0A097ELY6_9GAMM|nr:hypothetical protein [Francisella sp. FSC1006]AIT08581.1 type IV pili [Francisella sp. FSC1006]